VSDTPFSVQLPTPHGNGSAAARRRHFARSFASVRVSRSDAACVARPLRAADASCSIDREDFLSLAQWFGAPAPAALWRARSIELIERNI
jgi:hypothetical protein